MLAVSGLVQYKIMKDYGEGSYRDSFTYSGIYGVGFRNIVTDKYLHVNVYYPMDKEIYQRDMVD